MVSHGLRLTLIDRDACLKRFFVTGRTLSQIKMENNKQIAAKYSFIKKLYLNGNHGKWNTFIFHIYKWISQKDAEMQAHDIKVTCHY